MVVSGWPVEVEENVHVVPEQDVYLITKPIFENLGFLTNILAAIDDPGDMRMFQPCQPLPLVSKASAECGRMGCDQFQRCQLIIGAIVSPSGPHLTHAAP